MAWVNNPFDGEVQISQVQPFEWRVVIDQSVQQMYTEGIMTVSINLQTGHGEVHGIEPDEEEPVDDESIDIMDSDEESEETDDDDDLIPQPPTSEETGGDEEQ